MGTLTYPSYSGPTGTEMLVTLEASSPFTDSGGAGPIPSPAPPAVAISYSSSSVSPATSLTFGGNKTITINASSACSIIPSMYTYEANIYANGGGFSHEVLFSDEATTVSGNSISFTINTTSEAGLEPKNVDTELVVFRTN